MFLSCSTCGAHCWVTSRIISEISVIIIESFSFPGMSVYLSMTSLCIVYAPVKLQTRGSVFHL
jgi:hypothetical protein